MIAANMETERELVAHRCVAVITTGDMQAPHQTNPSKLCRNALRTREGAGHDESKSGLSMAR